MSTVRQVRPKAPLLLYLDDIVVLRKPHPCGGDTWRIVRLGADIGLLCMRCGRHVLVCHLRCAVGVVDDRGPFISGRDFDLGPRLKSAVRCPDLCAIRWRLR